MKTNGKTINELLQTIAAEKPKSAWAHGVKIYATELLDELADNGFAGYKTTAELEKALLNGAKDWREYSNGGGSYIYNQEIARLLCTPSELKRTKDGESNPNGRETWLDVQARALHQAANKIIQIAAA